jgi:hypothetical protein
MGSSVRRLVFAAGALAWAACMAGITACNYGVSTSTPTSPSSATAASSSDPQTSTLTYVHDIQPILASDCVRCHGPSRRDAGVDLSTYANVMRWVTPGNPGSVLVLVTQPGGLMYSQWLGNGSQKATLVYDWVMYSNAAQQ